ncbi:MAG TPA: ATP-binding protein [Candidatus Limnocylindrales bacterium]
MAVRAVRVRRGGPDQRQRQRPGPDSSGLGLYVSRALVRGMGGEVVVDPADPGRGTTFRLTLPGEQGDEA